jgi:uncharacterized protein
MNRADQAPEPSIEELLASIRLIISDADKQDPGQREPRALASPVGEGPSLYVPGEVSADEVFDLTDELVPLIEGVRPQPGSHQPVTRLQPSFESRRGGQMPPAEANGAQARGMHEPPAHALRPEQRRPAQQAAASKNAWSRREQPIDAAHSPVAAGAPGQDQIAARSPARNWNGDVQMPVPEQGPVSLFPAPGGKGQPERPGTGGGNAAGNQGGGSAQQQAEAQGGRGEQAEVAALVERLARSAIGVLEASELENATQVDFEQLDAASKAEVAEKFANAIESAAHAVQEGLNPPEKGQVKQAGPQEPPAAKVPAAEAPERGKEASQEPKAEDIAKAVAAAKTEANAEAPAKSEAEAGTPAKPQPKMAPAGPAQAAARPDVEPVKAASPAEPVQVQARPAAEPAAAQAVAVAAKPAAAPAPFVLPQTAQAQYVGPSQPPVPTQEGGALESVVREMLRPMLVQWLNENMPRILENAIRDEIATRGLLPKSDS